MLCKGGFKKNSLFLAIMLISLSFILTYFFIPKSEAAVTKYINYQGKLTDSAGNPVADATYSVRFRLYNHATDDAGAACLPGVNACMWEETKNVSTTSGLFSTSLGDTTAFVDADLGNYDGTTYYLAVKVAADSEMTPRKRISGALYALNSDKLDGLEGSSYARSDSTYLVNSADANLTNEVVVSDLAANLTIQGDDAAARTVTLGQTGVFDDLIVIDAGNWTVDVTGNASFNGTLDSTNKLTVSAGGAEFTGGIDNNSGGLTEAGAISGATTIGASGNVTTSAGDFIVGTTGLSESTATDDSGAYIIGAFDEFDNSASTNVQDVLDDLDAAISAGGAPTNATYLVNSANGTLTNEVVVSALTSNLNI